VERWRGYFRDLSIPLNGFRVFLVVHREDGVELSIPLNGFSLCSSLLSTLCSLALSIPLNGFASGTLEGLRSWMSFNSIEWIPEGARGPAVAQDPPFNSIEWIHGLRSIRRYASILQYLSIPLNGFLVIARPPGGTFPPFNSIEWILSQ